MQHAPQYISSGHGPSCFFVGPAALACEVRKALSALSPDERLLFLLERFNLLKNRQVTKKWLLLLLQQRSMLYGVEQ
jgi:hypothetical protein